MLPSVVVLEKHPSTYPELNQTLSGQFEITHFGDIPTAIQSIQNLPRLMIMNWDEFGISGLKRIKTEWPSLPVLVLASNGSVADAVTVLRLGGCNFVIKKAGQSIMDVVTTTIEKETPLRWTSLEHDHWWQGNSPATRQVLQKVQAAVTRNVNIILAGPAGTGKQSLSRLIHHNSPHSTRQFIRINLARFSSEHVDSQFWTALTNMVSEFETDLPHHSESLFGTILIENLNTQPMDFRISLIRVLQTKTTDILPADIRFIVSIARESDLSGLDITGFEWIDVPALDKRKEDFPDLITHCIEMCNQEFGKQVTSISLPALTLLTHYSWPGNLRELQSVIKCGVSIADGPILGLKELPFTLHHIVSSTRAQTAGQSLERAKDAFSNAYIRMISEKTEDTDQTVRLLGIPSR